MSATTLIAKYGKTVTLSRETSEATTDAEGIVTRGAATTSSIVAVIRQSCRALRLETMSRTLRLQVSLVVAFVVTRPLAAQEAGCPCLSELPTLPANMRL